MKTLKFVCAAIIKPIKRVCRFPKTIAKAVKQRQRQAALNKREAERLDRICNPSKYRGK
jgi:hypothetical protein